MTENTIMNYEEFKNSVKENILTALPEEFSKCRAEISTVHKNNVTFDAISIVNPKKNAAPVIYLNPLFKDYQDGKDMDTILNEIADIYVKNLDFSYDCSFIKDWEKVKTMIQPKLIRRKNNEELLKDVPHQELCDLEVIYSITVHSNNTERASITIKNHFLELWRKTTDEIHQAAIENMKNQCVPYFKNIMAMMKEMMAPDTEPMPDFPEESDNIPQMYVISNQEKIHGAAMILNESFMDEVAKKLGNKFVLLPSSIHEMLAVPKGHMAKECLKTMVGEVNEEAVPSQDLLSYSVYEYDAELHQLSILD